MSTPIAAPYVKSKLLVRVFDGTRKPVPEGLKILFRILDGNQTQVFTGTRQTANVLFDDIPFYDNLRDNHTVIVWAENYQQAGFTPVPLKAGVLRTVDLMLLPKSNTFNFSAVTWENLGSSLPALFQLLSKGTSSADDARNRYYNLMETNAGALACFFNIVTAMREIHLPEGNPLDYFRQIIWDNTFQDDRFFAYADKALVDQVRTASEQGLFQPEIGPGFFHPGATSSYKEVQFGEANVQLTFHENDTALIDGVNCIKVEPDIDFYRDQLAHTFLEVIPSAITSGRTDPKTVYVLRWIAGRHAGVPEFNPPYTIVARS